MPIDSEGRDTAATPHTAAPATSSAAWRHWFRHSPGTRVGILSAFEDPALTRMGGDIGAVYERSDRLEVVVRVPAADRAVSELAAAIDRFQSACVDEGVATMRQARDELEAAIRAHAAPPADRAELAARDACPRCGWARGHDYGCPNDPLGPSAPARVELVGELKREINAAVSHAPTVEYLHASINALARSTDAPSDEWTMIAPDGMRFSGASPLRAASAAARHGIQTDPVKAKHFHDAIASLQAENDAENARLLAEHGTLNCPACGGSGHIGDVATPPAAATSAYTPDATPREEVPEEQIIEAIRDLAEDGGRWPSDWVEACRRAIKLATPVAATSTPCASGEEKPLEALTDARILEVARESALNLRAIEDYVEANLDAEVVAFARECIALAATQAPAVAATLEARPKLRRLLNNFAQQCVFGNQNTRAKAANAIVAEFNARTPTAGNTEDAASVGAVPFIAGLTDADIFRIARQIYGHLSADNTRLPEFGRRCAQAALDAQAASTGGKS